MNALFIALVILAATGAFCGFFVTTFWIPGPDGWWWPALVRVLWQLGTIATIGLIVAFGVGSPLTRRFWGTFLGCSAVGALLCLNPLLDLVGGPQRMRGHADIDIHSSESIFADIEVRAADGSMHTMDMAGWPINAVEDRLRACDGSDAIDLLVLPHLGVVLEVSCTPPVRR